MKFVKIYELLAGGLKEALKEQGLQNSEMLVEYGADRYPEVKLTRPFVKGDTARIDGYIEVGVRVWDGAAMELANKLNAMPNIKAKPVPEGGEYSILHIKYWLEGN